MTPELKQKIDNYVTNGYTAEQQKIREATQQKMEVLPQLGRGNAAYSKYADQRFVRLYADRVNACTLAMANIMMDAYELYGAPLDGAILAAATRVRDETVAGMCSAVGGEMQLEGMRRARDVEHGKAIATSFRQQLTIHTHYVLNEVSCLVEQRKVMPKHRQGDTIVHVFQQGAANPKVVVGTDQSHNTVTISEHHIFAHLWDIITTSVPAQNQAAILERLVALEQEVGKPTTFRERWSDFRSAAADYWAFILPYLPAIQDFLNRHGVIT